MESDTATTTPDMSKDNLLDVMAMGGEVVKNPDSDSLLDMMAMKGEVVDSIDESQELLTNADSMNSDEKPPRLTEQLDEDSSSSSDELNSGYKLVMDIIIEEVLENEDE